MPDDKCAVIVNGNVIGVITSFRFPVKVQVNGVDYYDLGNGTLVEVSAYEKALLDAPVLKHVDHPRNFLAGDASFSLNAKILR